MKTLRLMSMVAVAACSPASGCGRDETPCLGWVEIGRTYEAEALQLFEPLGRDGGPRSEAPYSSFSPDWSCRDLLGDAIEGETVRFDAVALLTSETGSCAQVNADVDVPGVALEELSASRAAATTFRRVARIRTPQGCTGEYTIGIVRVIDGFLASEGEAALSDHMILRKFFPDETDASCLELMNLGNPCSDSWYARIVGPSGAQISRDA